MGKIYYLFFSILNKFRNDLKCQKRNTIFWRIKINDINERTRLIKKTKAQFNDDIFLAQYLLLVS